MTRILAFFVACAPLFAQGWQYTVNNNGFTALTHNSTSFLADSAAPEMFGLGWDGGEIEDHSSCTRSSGATWFQLECDPDTNKHFRLRVDVAGAGTDTLELTISLANLSSPPRALTSSNVWQATAVKWPTGTTFTPNTDGWNWIHSNWNTPAAMGAWSGGKLVSYMTEFEKLSVGHIGSLDRVTFSILSLPGQSYSIPSGATETNTLYIRHGTTESMEELAAPGYAAWREAYPQALIWDDRRPICANWISEKSQQSASNPRGYAWNADLDVTDGAAIKTALVTRVQAAIDGCKLHYGQGLILWDIEGQEFPHPMTYVGNPGGLFGNQSWMEAGGAPEIEQVVDGERIIDTLFRMIREAGLRPGLTLRPSTQTLGSGPPTGPCHSQGASAGDSYVDVTGTPLDPGRGYICQDTAVTFDDATDRVSCAPDCYLMANGRAVRFYSLTGTLPAGITQFATYYVCAWDEDNKHYQVGTASDCSAIVTSLGGSSGTVLHETWYGPVPFLAQHREAWNHTEALANLAAKVEYSRRRWGVDLFYVDTTFYVVRAGGLTGDCSEEMADCRNTVVISKELWRSLHEMFPDILVMPENSDADPYTGSFYSTNIGQWGRWAVPLALYPDHFVAPHLNVGYLDYINTEQQAFARTEMLAGTPYIASVFGPPTGEWNTWAYVVQDYEAAAVPASTLRITNTATGRTRSWSGRPREAFTYPLVLRAAFRGDASFTGSESTYCEMRAEARCYVDGVLQPTAGLDMSALTHLRLEYRTFTGRLVSAGAVMALD